MLFRSGDSSLSSCIEAIIALEIGEYDKAVTYARAALLMDLADVGGNVKDGCHIASMGGTWMVIAYGFGGLRDYDGKVSFRPQRPPETQASICNSRLDGRDSFWTWPSVPIRPATLSAKEMA